MDISQSLLHAVNFLQIVALLVVIPSCHSLLRMHTRCQNITRKKCHSHFRLLSLAMGQIMRKTAFSMRQNSVICLFGVTCCTWQIYVPLPYKRLSCGMLQVTCTVSGLEFLSVIRVEKRDEERQTSMVITDNGERKHPFSHLSRYKVHFDLVDDIGTVSIDYQGNWPARRHHHQSCV